uniref:Uncharacterized protein n=1 Tax=Aegilops tauschii subsp. strangulata TaxID=200361 RepID=A0A452YCJ2_AEGTS
MLDGCFFIQSLTGHDLHQQQVAGSDSRMGPGGGQAARVVARKTALPVELTSSVMELGGVGGPFSNVGLLELLLVASTPEGAASTRRRGGSSSRRGRPLDPPRPPLTVQLGGGTALIFFLMHVGSVFIHVRQSAGEHICLAVPKRTIFCSFYRQLRPARSLRHRARAVVRHPCYLLCSRCPAGNLFSSVLRFYLLAAGGAEAVLDIIMLLKTDTT